MGLRGGSDPVNYTNKVLPLTVSVYLFKAYSGGQDHSGGAVTMPPAHGVPRARTARTWHGFSFTSYKDAPDAIQSPNSLAMVIVPQVQNIAGLNALYQNLRRAR